MFETETSEWRPGKAKLQLQLKPSLVEFLASSANELEKALQAQPKEVADLQRLLNDMGWESYIAESNGTTYHNTFRAFQTSETEQLRVTVSFDSKGRLSISHHTWWRSA
jgi:hypothetical protein